MFTLDQLSAKNRAYEKTIKRWQFLHRSFLGGDVYREGKYLRHYFGEDQAPFDHYKSRLENTPLDNHVKTTVDIYRSFVFKTDPKRTFGTLAENEAVKMFIRDANNDNQDLNAFMKDASDWAMILGNVWLIVDMPSYQAQSAAEAADLGIRPYISMFSPQNVLDWHYVSTVSGKKQLTMLKVIERVDGNMHTLTVWTPIEVWKYVVKYDKENDEYKEIVGVEQFVNPLGHIPAINLMPIKGQYNGVGNSLVSDVADTQRSIYNKLSELEQAIRLSVHPTLAKTKDTDAAAGAGGIIDVPDNLDPGLFPQLLEASGSSVSSIIEAIDHDVKSIDNMTHLTAVRTRMQQPQSGVAMQTERQLLNSLLGDLADTIEQAEYKVWHLFFQWMDITPPNEFNIEYNKVYELTDVTAELGRIKQAKELTTDPLLLQQLDIQIAKLSIKDEEVLNMVIKSIESRDYSNTI